MTSSRILGLLAMPVLFLAVLYAAETRPGYFTNFNYLGGVLLLEVLLVTIWHYEKWFFVVLMMSFIWAGSNLPLWSAGNVVRWFFLGFGALVGLFGALVELLRALVELERAPGFRKNTSRRSFRARNQARGIRPSRRPGPTARASPGARTGRPGG